MQLAQSPETSSAAPAVVAIVLAAGKGSRFDATGVKCKSAQQLPDGTPMIRAVCSALLQHIPDITVVVGEHEQVIRDALTQLPVKFLHCSDAHSGMSASLRHAIALSPAATGWLIALADMPFVKADTIAKVMSALLSGARIVRPEYDGKPGHPVAFATEFKDELLALEGDEGARAVIQRHRDALTLVPVNDAGCLIDIDTPAQLQEHTGR